MVKFGDLSVGSMFSHKNHAYIKIEEIRVADAHGMVDKNALSMEYFRPVLFNVDQLVKSEYVK